MDKPIVHTLPKGLRLKRNVDFQRVYRRGKSVSDARLVLIYQRGRGHTRVGFTAGKKVGKSVVRNRAKRLMRENYRLIRHRVAEGWRVIFVARNAMVGASFQQVQDSMQKLLKKAGCL